MLGHLVRLEVKGARIPPAVGGLRAGSGRRGTMMTILGPAAMLVLQTESSAAGIGCL